VPRVNAQPNNGEPGGLSEDQLTGAPRAPSRPSEDTPLPTAPPLRDDVTYLGGVGVDVDATSLGTTPAGVPAHEEDVTTYQSLEDGATGYHPGGDDVTSFQPLDTPQPATPPPTDRARSGRRPAASKSGAQGPIEVGEAFGSRYHIIRVLGVGGMGAVYQAWDAELGVSVAIKVIRPEITADPAAADDIERRFKRELLLARQVTHPNVVRIHDLGDVDGIKYITMHFIEGADLATILNQETKLAVPRALRIARGVVSGLVSAHQAGVVHRDLKPANIMIGVDDTPTIMDFGIARSAGGPGLGAAPVAGVAPADLSLTAARAASSTVAGTIVGTVAYMAPEQAKGEVVDQRADIYAFGLILYDMLIGGRRSERAVSAVAELQERMQQAPPAPRTIDPGIPEAIDAIVRRCLEPDAARRFQTTVELQHALDRLNENGKPLPIIRRLTRRTMAVAAVLVLLLLGGTFYTARWLSAPEKAYDPVTVVIADFQNNTNDATFEGTLEQTVRRGLEGASFISAYDRSRIRVGLGVQPAANFDEVAARELAVKQGLGVVLAGAIDPRGNGYEISVKAIQTVTGDVIATLKTRAANKNEVLEAATKLMVSVRKELGDRTSTSDQLFAMRSLTASSLDVVSQYADAVEAQASGNFETAYAHYLKAVELDPEFGLGYQGLAAMSRNLGRLDEADKYIKEAFRYVDGMTERERFATRGYYYRMTGDNQQCAKEYGELLARYPGDTVAHNQRAGCLYKLRNMREADEEMQRAVELLPNHVGYRTNLALFAALSGRFEAAEAEVQSLPQATNTALLVLAYSQTGRGLMQEAAETYRKLGTMGAAGASTSASGLGDFAIYEGRFSEAVQILEEGAAADLVAKNPAKAAIKFTSIAYAHLLRGRQDLAVAAADTALSYSQSMPVKFLAARMFVEAGALDKARTLASALASELPAEPQAHGKIIEGQIALKSGNPREAIKILSEANGILDTWFGHFDLGRAYLEAGALPQADSEFDLCLTRRGEALSLMDEGPTYGYLPLAFYYQGRVREGLNTANFANAYREYLNVRGRSTEDPLLAEVRRRVGN
jgi:eukaryotic-like serine/threonine-protein kinase